MEQGENEALAGLPAAAKEILAPQPQVVIITDLDNSLIGPNAPFGFSKDNFKLMVDRQIPVCLCTSRTVPEVLDYYQRLGNERFPFIPENGGAIYLPIAYFGSETYQKYNPKSEGDFDVIPIGAPHEEVITFLRELSRKTAVPFRIFSQMTAEEVQVETGNPTIEGAERARDRRFGDLVVITPRQGENNAHDEDVRLFREAVEAAGFTYSRGGKYHGVNKGADKGKATTILLDLFKQKFGQILSIGIGDTHGDLPMLGVVDKPYLVARKDGSHEDHVDSRITMIDESGPLGWAVLAQEIIPRYLRPLSLSPYQEQKELWGIKKFNTLIVFGQGPCKPVLLESELTPQQLIQWNEFKKDPLHGNEPEFRVVEGNIYLSKLDDIDKKNLPVEEQNRLKEAVRQEWQRLGRFALNRWGRENALASGLALYLGLTGELILSGGKTMPKWAKEGSNALPNERQNNWPSEAQLMKDIMVRRFGDLYQKKFGKPIEEAIKIEDSSTNTLENLAYTINKNPHLLSKDRKVGLLASDFHTRRVGLLARLFSIDVATRGEISAQELLKERAEIRESKNYLEIQNYLKDALQNPDLRARLLGEETWERGLVNENFLAYWIGYLGGVSDVSVLQQVIEALKDPSWIAQARIEFSRAGINFDEFKDEDLTELGQQNPGRLNSLREGLLKLKTGLRVGPPVIKDKPSHMQ